MKVKVRGAKDLHNTEWFGKMDPYCKAKLSKNKTASSPEAHDAGTTPQWEWETVLPYEGEQALEFEVYDKDKWSGDDYVGGARVDAAALRGGFSGDVKKPPQRWSRRLLRRNQRTY